MKLFEVKYEEDGRTVKAPGVSETRVNLCSLYFAAESFNQVWEATASIRNDPERRYMGILEVLPLVTVLPSSESEEVKHGDM